ncbi:DNA methylase [Candidatus Avelusimicrobium sp.]|uniref:Y-family DNA polymerase n=1 Tax=Candidatus Avelusimicrobium sp. TaxID=3048833 RepID=UPI003D7E225B
MSEPKTYIAIDLKSFYASVECVERGLNPLTTNLVVADTSRTEKTICLAISPALKSYGIGGRARLFEVVQLVKDVNEQRRLRAPYHRLTGKSYNQEDLIKNPGWAVDYIAAPPQMARYMAISNQIYDIYLKYVAPEDIHNYSVDEVFIDATDYLRLYKLTAHEFARKLIHEVLQSTGITATAGIGTNLYLAKIAMDIVAKHIPADKDGVRIAQLNGQTYKEQLWAHTPITDFWRVGRGYAEKLKKYGLLTMGDIARCSLGRDDEYYNEELLYQLFGVNAELLIDHAWGVEPCTMKEIKSYKSEEHSIGSGQVLDRPYGYEEGLLITREMTDLLVLDLVEKGLMTDQLVLTVEYDIENLSNPAVARGYRGPVSVDRYGRKVPKPAHGSIGLKDYTSSTKVIMEAMSGLYQRVVDNHLVVRKIYITANRVLPVSQVRAKAPTEQLDLFTDYEALAKQKKREDAQFAKEHNLQETVLDIKKKFGKNAIVKGMNLKKGAKAIERNKQIGGHKA